MIKSQELKKVLLDNINSYFENHEFHYEKKSPGYYMKKTPECVYSLVFSFKDRSNMHELSKIRITHKSVEAIIMRIGLPNIDLSYYLSNEYFLDTVSDKRCGNQIFQGSKINIEDIIFWSEEIIKYMETEGAQFIKKYSYLPNILIEMNMLEQRGKYWIDILSGGLDHIFRGLIISKLCNDSDFERKLNKYGSLILQEKYLEWHPFFYKLKEALSSIEPKYNLDA